MYGSLKSLYLIFLCYFKCCTSTLLLTCPLTFSGTLPMSLSQISTVWRGCGESSSPHSSTAQWVRTTCDQSLLLTREEPGSCCRRLLQTAWEEPWTARYNSINSLWLWVKIFQLIWQILIWGVCLPTLGLNTWLRRMWFGVKLRSVL